ncbi:MAG TPA: heavy metal-associated domain-containing protein [Bacillota bacterium]|jgi:copper chaperone|nr:heavy-metal-associated domain-containing protein [Fastidiosipila sp.]HPX93314.1 heavy metal-associated domain-containing protein [Bacillota bacterium]HQB80973.1 heavy metal-associated domain-containing protein [Bacillota bacterium]
MKSAIIQLETLICPSCSQKIAAALKQLDGVEGESVTVSFSSSRAKLDFDETQVTLRDIENAIDRVGFEVVKSKIR